MSPLTLRRFRAERLLQSDFEKLRSRVLSSVRARLGGAGTIDEADLEACYAQAWHGLYAAVLEGQEIDNPAGWLVVATFRRAIEERRSAFERLRADGDLLDGIGGEHDIAARIDDVHRLRALFEGMRLRLSKRECEAASLCYLQGLSRAEAAAQMGLSERRMRKLMEGDGQRKRGVSGKVGELMTTVRSGAWCEEQASLMRALAFGMLDPDGERYVVARSHHQTCPSCRRYVLSLRGMAAVMPPLMLPHGLIAGALGGSAGVGAGAGSGAGAAAGTGAGTGVAGLTTTVAPASWLPAGGTVSAKLLGVAIALTAGTGGVVLAGNGLGAHAGRSTVAAKDLGQESLHLRNGANSRVAAVRPASGFALKAPKRPGAAFRLSGPSDVHTGLELAQLEFGIEGTVAPIAEPAMPAVVQARPGASPGVARTATKSLATRMIVAGQHSSGLPASRGGAGQSAQSQGRSSRPADARPAGGSVQRSRSGGQQGGEFSFE